ncbi:MAG: hypothetical protein V3U29_05640 [Phycisphaeraceae bacterium]
MWTARLGLWVLLLDVILFGVAAGQDAAPQVEIITMDGHRYVGELHAESTDQIILLIEGIKTPIDRDQIANVRYIQTIEQQYEHRRAELADNDLDGRYNLAFWLFNEKAYDLAGRELAELSDRFPDDERVKLLSRVVAERIKLLEQTAADEQPPRPREDQGAGESAGPRPGAQAPRLPKNKLTDQQWNLIRVYELPDLAEAQPSYVTVSPDAINKLLADYAARDEVPKGRSDQLRLRRAPGWEKAQLIFELKARSLYGDIQVRSDPPVMATFRRRVHQQYVLNNCGTSRCHGGAEAGDLFLFRRQPNREDTVYTNFYILHRYANANGRMIDRAEPRRSLLLQYGLMREAAATAHPDVPGWRHQFVNEQDPRFVTYVDWISSLWQPVPNYGIDYQVPKPGAKEQQPIDEPGPGVGSESIE